jgi:hypothetical protein
VSRSIKIRARRSENSAVSQSLPALRAQVRKVYVANPPKPPTATATVEPSRLRLILARLQDQFYDSEPASVRIAAAVLPDLTTLDESRSALPH